jgi:hypothetical protein
MSPANLGSVLKCFICKSDKEAMVDHRIVVVTENSFTFRDESICLQCKKAYDLGYKDGLDDSVG